METIWSKLISTTIVPVITESRMDITTFSLAFISPSISTMKYVCTEVRVISRNIQVIRILTGVKKSK